jgi:glutamate formiminotransferase
LENNKEKVDQIKKDIKSLTSDLEKIQSECKHEKTVIKFVPECNSVRKVCSICEHIIGYPTEQELKDNDFLT